MIRKEPSPHTDKVRVTFILPPSLWATSVHLVGDFNRWDPQATPLRLSEACWYVTLELDAGRNYRYRYLIDGSGWLNESRADYYEIDVTGQETSVLVTPPTLQQFFGSEMESAEEPQPGPQREESPPSKRATPGRKRS